MAEASFDVHEAHQWFAKELNNLAWDLVEQQTRTDEETERMIHAAHASCYHWLQVGTLLNQQRAECLLATAYTLAGQPESALRHAQRCLSLSQQNGGAQTPFDRATAHGCAATAYVRAGRLKEAGARYRLAEQAAAQFEQAEDSEVLARLYPPPPANAQS